MKARHRAAALAIFASRNPSEKKIYEEGVLDLHGLHVARQQRQSRSYCRIFSCVGRRER